MDDCNFLDIAGHGPDVCGQFVLIRMAGVGIQGSNLRPDCVRFAKNIDRILSGQNLSAQSMLGAIADEQYQIFGIADVVLEVVPHPARFAHS